MKLQIIGDSSLDLPRSEEVSSGIVRVPLTIQVGDTTVVDNGQTNQADFLKLVKAESTPPKTACPSPFDYMQAFRNTDADMIFCITLSKEVSGSYNAAVLGKNLYEEEGGEKKVHIVDSMSASSGEYLLARQLREFHEAGMSFEEMVEKIEEKRKKNRTLFVLEDLDPLRKNGRMSSIQSFFAGALNIKLVCSQDNGHIVKLSQHRGIQAALKGMAKFVEKTADLATTKCLVVAHCNAPKRAEEVRDMILRLVPFRESEILEMRLLSSTYAADGGIVVAY